MSERFDLDPADVDWTENAIGAAWHEFRYPRPATDAPTESFKRAVRAALDTYRAAGLLRTEPAAPRVPQPGDRVLVQYHPLGCRAYETTVTETGDYTGRLAVDRGSATVEVIEPAPACTDMGCTRIGGRCVGYHCPHCGQPTGMAGHRCRPADTGQKPAPATTFAATGQHAFGLLALGDRDEARTELAAADLKTLFAIGDVSHALNELVAEVLRSHPADTGKETDRD